MFVHTVDLASLGLNSNPQFSNDLELENCISVTLVDFVWEPNDCHLRLPFFCEYRKYFIHVPM